MTGLDLFSNMGDTTVTSGGTDAPAAGTEQSWTVASSSTFPAASSSATPKTQFHIVDVANNGEIIRVKNVSGTTWTVIRGSEGTTPVAHVSGFRVRNVVVASWLRSQEDGRVLNVKKFGAVGDGTTDDTTAIANTLVEAGSGGTVLFPPGNYKVTTSLQVPVLSLGGLRLIGSGIETTKITFSGTGFAFLIGDGGVNNAQWTYIEDIKIVGDATNADGGVKFNHTRFCGLKRVDIRDFTKAAAIGVHMVTEEHNYFALIDESRISNVDTGIKLDSADGSGIGANSNLIRQCHFGTHDVYAIHIVGGDTNVVEACEFNGGVTTACFLEDVARNTKFLNNQFDGPTNAINISESAVVDTFILGNSGGAILDSGVRTVALYSDSTVGRLYARDGLIVGGANMATSKIPLAIRGATSHAANLLAVQDPTGATTYFYVDQNGNADVRGTFNAHSHSTYKADVGANSVVMTIDQQGSSNGGIGLRMLQRSSGTTGDMMTLRNSAGTTTYSRFNKDGYFATVKNAAPADADINNGEVFLWLDATAAAPKLMAKGKDSAGTVFSHQLSP